MRREKIITQKTMFSFNENYLYDNSDQVAAENWEQFSYENEDEALVEKWKPISVLQMQTNFFWKLWGKVNWPKKCFCEKC